MTQRVKLDVYPKTTHEVRQKVVCRDSGIRGHNGLSNSAVSAVRASL